MAGRGNRSALAELLSGKNRADKLQELEAVSYTHLTLPTTVIV